MPISLLHKRQYFATLIPRLINKAIELGFDVAVGEVQRGKEQAAHNATIKLGSKRSLHIDGLAIDLMLYKDDTWLTNSDDYRPLGEWWEKQSSLPEIECVWGGRFKEPVDGNHFSIKHEGRK